MLCLFLAVLMAEGSSAPPANVVITKPVANMYSRASTDSDVVSQAIYGWNARILEDRGAWINIETNDGYRGWLPADSALRRAPYAAGSFLQVDNLFANLYREQDITTYQPVITLPYEARLERVRGPEGENGRWILARLADGREAWIQTGDVTADPKPHSIPEVIEFSRRFLGLPYLWGGTSTYGYDCSGFTQMLCRRRGITIPRDADIQAAWKGMTPVTPDNLQPGDLLYFGGAPDKITHTGMYIGNGEFINATPWHSPVIQIDRLDDPHWTKLLVAARRIQ